MKTRPLAITLVATSLLAASASIASGPPIKFAERQLAPDIGSSLVVGELDGNPGPEVVGVSGGNVLVLRNLGGRAFSSVQSIPMAGGSEFRLALPDVDGDGRRDLVTLRSSPPAVVLRANLGGFNFAPALEYALPSSPRALATGDMNGDSRDDIIAFCQDTAAVFMGLPGGSLAGPTLVPIGPGAFDVPALADLDGDTKLDLVLFVGDYPSWSLQWRHGNGDGTFGAPNSIPGTADFTPHMAAMDFDLDGDADIIASTNTGVIWLENDGSGAFTRRAPLPFDLHTTDPAQARIGDVDGDGRLDVVLAERTFGIQNNLVEVAYSAADSAAHCLERWHVPYEPTGLALADLDGDGRLDVATSCTTSSDNPYYFSGGPSTAILWNDAHGGLLGRLEARLQFPYFNSSSESALLALRRAADTPPDLVASTDQRARLLRNVSDAMFAAPESIGVGHPLAAADLDGDGADDLVLTRSDSAWVFLRDTTTLGFAAPGPLLAGGVSLGLGDLNGDGRTDLVTEGAAGSIAYRPGDGSGGFGANLPFGAALQVPHGAVLIRDLDGDGRTEIVFAEASAVTSGDSPSHVLRAVLHVLHNDGAGHFASDEIDSLRLTYASGSSYSNFGSALTVADVDGDGDRDVVLSMGNGGVSLGWFGAFLNDGAGHFHAAGPAQYGGNPGGDLASADLNGDALADVIIAQSDGLDFDLGVFPASGGGAFGTISYFIGADAMTRCITADFDGDARTDVAVLGYNDNDIVMLRNATEYAPIPTPALASLVSAALAGGIARIEWWSPDGAAFKATLQRALDDGAWMPIATIVADGAGHVRYEDAGLLPGHRYGYRLWVRDETGAHALGEAWLGVPARAFSIQPPVPNPSTGRPAFVVSLPDAGEGALDIIDVSGRLVRRATFRSSAAGQERVSFEREGTLAPGLYFARARMGRETTLARFVVIR